MNKISDRHHFDRGKPRQEPEILLEDNHLLIVNKPAGLATMGVAEHEESLVTWTKAYLKQKYNKPGNVYLGVVSRLDAPVTGVVVMARTSKAAARLTEQFRSRSVEKIYWTLVSGRPRPSAASIEDWLRKDERHRKVHICQEHDKGAQLAKLSYQTISRQREKSLLEIQLQTGRKHQIRVQLAHLGHPVIGDRKYGSRIAFASGIALHSRKVKLTHPVKHMDVEIRAPLPSSWALAGIEESDCELS